MKDSKSAELNPVNRPAISQADHQTGLLVSVRNSDEARLALSAGADLIDVKEPLNGPLGAASPKILRTISNEFSELTTLSAALGELVDLEQSDHPLTRELPTGFKFAKIGLANTVGIDWQTRLAQRFKELPVSTQRVVVAYADWESCEAPAPEEVIESAADCKADALLVDTFSKAGKSTFDFLGVDNLQSIIVLAKERKLLTVIAGGLTENLLDRAVQLCPDFVAVRGAACASKREGTICESAVRHLKATLTKANAHCSLNVKHFSN